jgi:hypothetical protein
MADNSPPIILLAFANDRSDGSRYLRELPKEEERVREVLRPAEQLKLCEVVPLYNTTIDRVLRAFQDPGYHDRIQVFHFAGHSDSYRASIREAFGQAAGAIMTKRGGAVRSLVVDDAPENEPDQLPWSLRLGDPEVETGAWYLPIPPIVPADVLTAASGAMPGAGGTTASGTRSVAIGGDAKDATITTGDDNTIR